MVAPTLPPAPPLLKPEIVAEIKALEASNHYDSPRYMELLMEQHYLHHILRLPPEAPPIPDYVQVDVGDAEDDAVDRLVDHDGLDVVEQAVQQG